MCLVVNFGDGSIFNGFFIDNYYIQLKNDVC